MLFLLLSASKYTTDDLVNIVLGHVKEVDEFHKYRRLIKNDKSFQQSYDKSLATIQIMISKKHRELKEKQCAADMQHMIYAEMLLNHWGMYH